MRRLSLRWLAALALVGACATSLRAEYLKNTDFKDSIAGWHGDASPAFLKADGTEDPMGDPVIKLISSRGNAHMVYQEFRMSDKPASLHLKVDVMASSDYQRSQSNDDYASELLDYGPGAYFTWAAIGICRVDFWIRAGASDGSGDWHYKLAAAPAGKWVTVDTQVTPNAEDWIIYFCTPPGEGAIYLKNPSAAP